MKYLEIGGQKCPFYLSFLKISKFCNKQGYGFSQIGTMLEEQPIEGLYGLIAIGLTAGSKKEGGKKKEWTPEMIDEKVGTDMKQIEAFGEFIGDVLGVEKNEDAPTT